MNQSAAPFQAVDEEARRLACRLLRTARHGALAVLDPTTGAPAVSRVGVCTAIDGTPILLLSGLAPHTAALRKDVRCSLLLGEAGKGDPLAHPRLAITARAAEVARDSEEHGSLRSRYLNHQPKAGLYVDLGDFRFFRLEPVGASLNGGFGKAYHLGVGDLLMRSDISAALVDVEPGAVEHMNQDHPDAVDHYARYYLKAPQGDWVLAGIDEDGITIFRGDDVRRIAFETPLTSAEDLHPMLVRMATTARAGLEASARP